MAAELLVTGLAGQHARADVDLMNQLAGAAVTHPGGRPWHLWPVDNGVEIRSERWRGVQPSKVGDRTIRLTAGAALANLRLGIAILGYRPVVTFLPDARRASVLAVIRSGERHDPTPVQQRMFVAIRAVGRSLPPLGDYPVAPGFLQHVRAVVEAEGMWLRSVDDLERERLMSHNTKIAAMPPHARLMVIGSNHDVAVAHIRAGLALQGLALTARTLGGTVAVVGWPADLADAAPLPGSLAGRGMCPLLLVGVGRSASAAPPQTAAPLRTAAPPPAAAPPQTAAPPPAAAPPQAAAAPPRPPPSAPSVAASPTNLAEPVAEEAP